MSPPKFKLDEDTALKTNYLESTYGKDRDLQATPFKMQNLEELALGLPNLEFEQY